MAGLQDPSLAYLGHQFSLPGQPLARHALCNAGLGGNCSLRWARLAADMRPAEFGPTTFPYEGASLGGQRKLWGAAAA